MSQLWNHDHHQKPLPKLSYPLDMLTYQAPPMKKRVRRLKILVSQTHTTKSFVVKDIDTAASIHELLSEFVTSNLRRNH